nr:HAD-IC family P-type ATPase [Arenimonas sp.]
MNEPLTAPEAVATGESARTFQGLSSTEAAERLARDGPNLLPQPEQRAWWAIILNILREPMLLMLLSATAIYLLLGDPGEAAVLGASVLIVIALTAYQEQKSERALQALRELSSPRARVLRDGEARLVAGRDVVVGDVVLVAEGDRVPADARVFEEWDLQVDESMLTGESVPVHCTVSSGDDAQGLLHASTLVVRGRGAAEVVAIGAQTSVGRIGAQLGGIQAELTPLQREIRRVVALFALLSVASCLLMTGLYVATRGGWLDGLLAGVTLAMANLPEEFPIVLTVFLALGAWRMAQHKALVRRASAIEALGAITVLCTDKTGTLTENRMAVAKLAPDAGSGSVPDSETLAERRLLETAVLACQPRSHDPMERALQELAAHSEELRVAVAGARHVREYPLSAECTAVAHAWSQAGRDGLVVACKGAPETVADLCGLAAERRAVVLAEVETMARGGLRVLAAASWDGGADIEASGLPDSIRDFRFRWLGLIGFADPLRSGVAEAVLEAQAAGIRLIMLTGDHLETARAIALQAGLAATSEVALGSELDDLDEQALAQRVCVVNVFARARPEHKLRLVNALKGSGDVVAMTGDGVNDAPALMAAHVGIAMGGRGTDVAREAASIVLLDDNFVTVVRAIHQGRSIYDNILRAVSYILAVHVPITGLALLP